MPEFYSCGGINWVWYVQANLNDDGSVTILLHDRLHRCDHLNHPKIVGSFNIVENDKRYAVAIDIQCGKEMVRYPVANSRHVFDYPDFDPIDYPRL